MRPLLLLLAGAALAAAQSPRLFYSKTFPGSKPAYQEVRLERDGKAEYREAPDEADPIRLTLLPAEADTVFALADKLDHFKRELESGLKVARMGEKLYRWDQGAETHTVKFNFSTDADAQALQDWFERAGESAQLFIELGRTARYDKLGVNQSLLQLEASWDRKRLLSLPLFLPLLDRVAKNDSYLNMARERAARLAATFREPAAKAPAADARTQ